MGRHLLWLAVASLSEKIPDPKTRFSPIEPKKLPLHTTAVIHFKERTSANI
jgi:hypothetical protein